MGRSCWAAQKILLPICDEISIYTVSQDAFRVELDLAAKQEF